MFDLCFSCLKEHLLLASVLTYLQDFYEESPEVFAMDDGEVRPAGI